MHTHTLLHTLKKENITTISTSLIQPSKGQVKQTESLLPPDCFLPLCRCSSQPVVLCRQCPGYRNDVGQLLFTAASNFWPGLQPPPVPPPPRAEESGEGSSPAAVDQPSTSSSNTSGDHQGAAGISPPHSSSFSDVSLFVCGAQLLRSTAAPRRATISSAPAACSQCLTDGRSSTLSHLILSNVSSSPRHAERLLPGRFISSFGVMKTSLSPTNQNA